MSKLDSQKLMAKAIEVMRQSIPEPRVDGKASPLVGAVLWKPDGSIDTACRGEIRDGDHAEYTLLERKNRDSKLDGSVLFATLEPCAPGSRRHPKLACAERIVLARIKEVWIGIEDPDPTVDRKGIKFLQDSGVTVHMFDREFQEAIRVVNKDFIEQAMERAAAQERKQQNTSLSSLENALKATTTTDFSDEALSRYISLTNLTGAVGSQELHRRLIQLGLLKLEADLPVPTGFGILLFGKEPRASMQQAGLLGTIHFEDGSEELKNFEGPQVLVPEQVLQWLRDKLPNPIERTGARRKGSNDALFELVREGVVNALVHRDYDVEGAKCQLSVTTDAIIIKSPGKPVEPITLAQMQSFTAPMLSRNPVLHYVFAQMELAEERGLGLKSMKDRATDAGLPLPSYAWEDPYLVLKLLRSASAAVGGLKREILEQLNKTELAGLEWLTQKEVISSSEYAEAMGIPNRTALHHLRHFVELGLIRKQGSGPNTSYKVTLP